MTSAASPCLQQVQQHHLTAPTLVSKSSKKYAHGIYPAGSAMSRMNSRSSGVTVLCRGSSSSGAQRYNPQNTDQPMVLPDPSLSAVETVSVQLSALQESNEPWANHGIQTAYEFGYDVGGLDPSMYFAYPTDLYHLDHFMGKFQNRFPDLVNSSSFRVVEDGVVEPADVDDVDAVWTVDAQVVGGSGKSETTVRFHLKRKKVGSRKGSLMTYMIETLSVK